MDKKQSNDYWLNQLFKAQEIRLHPPCHPLVPVQPTQCETCWFEVCQQAGTAAAEALDRLAGRGFPKFALSRQTL